MKFERDYQPDNPFVSVNTLIRPREDQGLSIMPSPVRAPKEPVPENGESLPALPPPGNILNPMASQLEGLAAAPALSPLPEAETSFQETQNKEEVAKSQSESKRMQRKGMARSFTPAFPAGATGFGAGNHQPGSNYLSVNTLIRPKKSRGVSSVNSGISRLEISQPDDPAELEADRVAEAVVNGGITPKVFKANLSIHRASDPENDATESLAHSLIVEDTLTELAPGQMRKLEFLGQLELEIRQGVDQVLAGIGRSTMDCPYLEYWLAFYTRQDYRHIERTILKYVPEAAGVKSAQDYVAFIVARARRSAEVWAKTGTITGVSKDLPKDGPEKDSGVNGAGPKPIALKSGGGGTPTAANPQAIRAELGFGRPLEGGVKSSMESAFGLDFSGVQIHTDSKAAGLSTSLNAKAFTIGNDIAFGTGEYQPGTMSGAALLAHELAHVAQQRGAAETAAAMKAEGAEYEGLEKDAGRSAVGAMLGLWRKGKESFRDIAGNAAPRLKSGLRLQRCTEFEIPVDEFQKNENNPLDQSLKDRIFDLSPELVDEFKVLTGISWIDIAKVAVGGISGLAETLIENNYRLYTLNEELKEYELSLADLFTLIRLFQDKALFKAKNMIFENQKIIKKERERYHDENNLKGLYDSITGNYAKKFDSADRLRAQALMKCFKELVPDSSIPLGNHITQKIFNLIPVTLSEDELAEFLATQPPDFAEDTVWFIESVLSPPSIINMLAPKSTDPRFEKAKKIDYQTYKDLRTVGAQEYPILADVHADFRRMSRAFGGGFDKNSEKFKESIMGLLNDRYRSGDKTIEILDSDPTKVWELAPLIQLTMMDEKISQEDKVGQLIWDRVEDVQTVDTIRSMGLAAVGVVLGIAGFFTEGATWVALGAGEAAVSAIDLYYEIQAYQLHSNAAEATLGAELSDDPDISGIVFAIAGLVADTIHLGAGGIKMINRAAKDIKNLDNEIEIRKKAGDLYEQLEKEGKKVTVSKNNFITTIQKARLDYILSPTELAEFNQLIAKLDLRASPFLKLGLTKMFKKNRIVCAKILEDFQGQPKVLERLSEHVRNGQEITKLYSQIYELFGKNAEDAKYVLEYYGREGATAIKTLPAALNDIRTGNIHDRALMKEILTKYQIRGKIKDLTPGSTEHKLQRWRDYQKRYPARYPKITDDIDPQWSQKYDTIIENSKFGRGFETQALEHLKYKKNNLVLMNEAGIGFIPDSIKGNPTIIEWGQPYDFVEVKGWEALSNTGNLKRMIEYVQKYGGSIEAVLRSEKHPKGMTKLSEPLNDILDGLIRAGKAKKTWYP